MMKSVVIEKNSKPNVVPKNNSIPEPKVLAPKAKTEKTYAEILTEKMERINTEEARLKGYIASHEKQIVQCKARLEKIQDKRAKELSSFKDFVTQFKVVQ